jgi:hypothetical protein
MKQPKIGDIFLQSIGKGYENKCRKSGEVKYEASRKCLHREDSIPIALKEKISEVYSSVYYLKKKLHIH